MSPKGSMKEMIYESSHTPLKNHIWEGSQTVPLVRHVGRASGRDRPSADRSLV